MVVISVTNYIMSYLCRETSEVMRHLGGGFRARADGGGVDRVDYWRETGCDDLDDLRGEEILGQRDRIW